MKLCVLFIFFLTGSLSTVCSSTIEEKLSHVASKEGNGNDPESFLAQVNQGLVSLRQELQKAYEEVPRLQEKEAKDEEYHQLLAQVNKIKSQILELETKWHDLSVNEAKKEEEGYALWDQEETTLAQLVMEYGAMDFLYILPPDMGNLKLHMHSNIPVPRESWSEMLEIILAHNGIGVKKLNPYARQLYILKQDLIAVQRIASTREDLLLMPSNTRLCYIFSPPMEHVKTVFQFFERFADSKQTFVYQVGRKIAIVTYKEEVEKLLTLYDTVWEDPKGKISKVISVAKMSAKEMEKILQSFFGDSFDRSRPPFGRVEQESLTILTLGQGRSLVLIGQQEVVDRAEKIVKETEDQLQDPSEMTIFLYQCRHSDPNDLAKLLEKVYASLISAVTEGTNPVEVNYAAQGPMTRNPEGYPPNVPPLVVPPPPQLKPEISSTLEIDQGAEHFIPDPKTGTLLMVVRRDALGKIKELLRKLDVPKKMVQIEVLLFERRLNSQNNFGLNLLKIGSKRNFVTFESLSLGGVAEGEGRQAPPGILEFFFSHGKTKHFPAFDIAYNFMMTQEDIHLNAAPSVITVNQTPASISIVEEISINNGAAPINTSSGTIAFENSFSRAQYGITIVITPTIHAPDREDEKGEGNGFVTLQTNINFDTTNPSINDRPLVDKRHIENEVRVVDGQTVILGGLRRKTSIDAEEKLPFFGELPGIGKLFGTTKLTDNNTEMIFFITPKIILDPQEELDQLRAEELKKRAGDLPEFLQRVVEARNKEKRKFFENSLKLLFGNPNR